MLIIIQHYSGEVENMGISRRQFMKRGAVAATALSLGSIHCGKEQRPNIIVLFSDELDPKYLSCYGGDFPTPNIDTLAQKGVRFTKAYVSASMCTPSRFSLLTGKYPGRCATEEFKQEFPPNVPYNIAWNTGLDGSLPTVASLLSKSGYLTGAVGKWHNGIKAYDEQLPKFDLDDDPADEQVDRKLRERNEIVSARIRHDAGFDVTASVNWGNFDNFPIKALRYHNFPWMTKGAVDFIKQGAAGSKPFFLYAATTAVHGPFHADAFDHDPRFTVEGYVPDVIHYQPPVDEFKAKLAEYPQYMHHRLAGIMDLEYHVGQVLKTVRDLGIEDNTVFVFLSDHNVEPGKATCYEKGNHVPMLMTWPGKITPKGVNHNLVQSVDILPTLAQIAGAKIDASILLDGVDYMPAVAENKAVRNYIYLESGYTRAVNDGRYKYIAFRPPQSALDEMEQGKTKYAPNHLDTFKQAHSQIAMQHYPSYFDPDQLYDLEKDPYEQHNVINNPEYKEIQERLRSELKRRLATFNNVFDLETPPFMLTNTYKKMADNTRAIGTDFIEWLARDHGTIVFPPKE